MTGLDTNILVYALDPTFPEHAQARDTILDLESWFVNPTVIHEAYHTLVFKRKISPRDAMRKLVEFLKDNRTIFINQTIRSTLFSIGVAAHYNLGGRDSLIIGCYLFSKVSSLLTHDEEILNLKELNFKGRRIEIKNAIR